MSSHWAKQDEILRVFHEVKKLSTEDPWRAQTWDCNTIPRSRNFHLISLISVVDPTQLMMCDLSYFYVNCQSQNWNLCVNKTHVPPWSLVKIRVHNTRVIRRQMMQSLEEEENSQFGGDLDILTEELQIG
jgi:hypothetical protein